MGEKRNPETNKRIQNVLKYHPHSIVAGFSQQVEAVKRKITIPNGEFFFSFFMRSCSRLGLFRRGVFGIEWQENVTGTSVGLCGLPAVSHISMRALCDGQLQNSVYT